MVLRDHYQQDHYVVLISFSPKFLPNAKNQDDLSIPS